MESLLPGQFLPGRLCFLQWAFSFNPWAAPDFCAIRFLGFDPGRVFMIPSSWWCPIWPGLDEFQPASAALFRRNAAPSARVFFFQLAFSVWAASDSFTFSVLAFNPGRFLMIPSSWWRPIWPGLEEFWPASLFCFAGTPRLLLEFSFSVLGRSPRFHLWINP